MGRFDNVDNTRLVMNEFDLQQQVVQVYQTPTRDLTALDPRRDLWIRGQSRRKHTRP